LYRKIFIKRTQKNQPRLSVQGCFKTISKIVATPKDCFTIAIPQSMYDPSKDQVSELTLNNKANRKAGMFFSQT